MGAVLNRDDAIRRLNAGEKLVYDWVGIRYTIGNKTVLRSTAGWLINSGALKKLKYDGGLRDRYVLK